MTTNSTCPPGYYPEGTQPSSTLHDDEQLGLGFEGQLTDLESALGDFDEEDYSPEEADQSAVTPEVAEHTEISQGRKRGSKRPKKTEDQIAAEKAEKEIAQAERRRQREIERIKKTQEKEACKAKQRQQEEAERQRHLTMLENGESVDNIPGLTRKKKPGRPRKGEATQRAAAERAATERAATEGQADESGDAQRGDIQADAWPDLGVVADEFYDPYDNDYYSGDDNVSDGAKELRGPEHRGRKSIPKAPKNGRCPKACRRCQKAKGGCDMGMPSCKKCTTHKARCRYRDPFTGRQLKRGQLEATENRLREARKELKAVREENAILKGQKSQTLQQNESAKSPESAADVGAYDKFVQPEQQVEQQVEQQDVQQDEQQDEQRAGQPSLQEYTQPAQASLQHSYPQPSGYEMQPTLYEMPSVNTYQPIIPTPHGLQQPQQDLDQYSGWIYRESAPQHQYEPAIQFPTTAGPSRVNKRKEHPTDGLSSQSATRLRTSLDFNTEPRL